MPASTAPVPILETSPVTAFNRQLRSQPESDHGPATDALFDRLSDADLEAVHSALSDTDRLIWESATHLERKRLVLSYGLQYGTGGVAELTGLSAAIPPDGVHLMGRGLAGQVGGSYYHADLVLDWLDAVGQSLTADAHLLDFSCSSGRVVRALAGARPDVHWYGCDPNAAAIAWAAENLAPTQFFTSGLTPPLPFEDGFLDAAYAISVWSHYSASAALLWLGEMHRLIRPGGHLILTAHGLNSCAWFGIYRDAAIEARLGPAWITQTAERLEREGHCFWSVFGPEGDDGVVASDWGLSFFTPEWLLENVTPAWSLAMYRIGRADGNQDVFALTRR
jgi:SAM-dependent methyltransferase